VDRSLPIQPIEGKRVTYGAAQSHVTQGKNSIAGIAVMLPNAAYAVF